jgi:hypothetical protein
MPTGTWPGSGDYRGRAWDMIPMAARGRASYLALMTISVCRVTPGDPC